VKRQLEEAIKGEISIMHKIKKEWAFFRVDDILRKYGRKKASIEEIRTFIKDCKGELRGLRNEFGGAEDRIKYLDTKINAN